MIERGTHDELLTQNGLYFALMNSQENKASDENNEAETDARKESKKLSLHEIKNLDQQATNKVTKIKDTEEQMDSFDVFSYTKKMMDLNKENICYLYFGLFSCFIKAFLSGTNGFWYSNLLLTLLMVVGNETQAQDDQSWNDFLLYGGVYLS